MVEPYNNSPNQTVLSKIDAMQKLPILVAIIIFSQNSCNSIGIYKNAAKHLLGDAVVKIDMNLSAFGVESDSFPSIQVYINFNNDSSTCIKSYYNPAIKGCVYQLSVTEIKEVLALLQSVDLAKLKENYTVGLSDQPTATTTIYTAKGKFTIRDYGLEGEYPMQELYKIVFKY